MSKYLEFEKYLVASSIIDEQAAINFLGSVDPEELNDTVNMEVMTAIKTILNKRKKVDIVAIAEESETLSKVDIMELGDLLPTASNFEYYLEKYLEYRRKYKLHFLLSNLKDMSSNEVYDEICKVMNEKKVAQSKALDELLLEAVDTLQNDEAKISTGFRSLDRITCGISTSSLVIISATPKTGKSTFALNMAYKMATSKKKVLYFSFEMSAVENAQKIVSMCSLNYSGSKDKYMDNYNSVAKGLSLKFITTSSMDVMQIKAEIMREKPDIVFIDQLDCIPTPKKERYDIAVGDVVVKLKNICVDENIPIFLLHQLGRDSMKTDTPQLYHLKNSQIVEQKADLVMMLKRNKDAPDMSGYEDVDVFVKANRMGGEGFVTLKMNPRMSAFREGGEYISNTYVNKSQLPF